MPLSLFQRLRRCRVLFALTLCAWLALGSTVRAQADCCASMHMHGMSGMQVGHHHVQYPQPHTLDHGACSCAHAAVDRLTLLMKPAGSSLPEQTYARALPQHVPQPMLAPPLRPPVV